MQPCVIKPFAPADTGWIVDRHGALYARDEGFDATFPALVAAILADFADRAVPGRDAGWVAWQGDTRQGCIFVVAEAPGIAKLRLVLVEPESRGTGLAQALLETALGFARAAGYASMRLWTHESHVAAGRLYAHNGFSLVESEARQAFGQPVVAQIWQRKL